MKVVRCADNCGARVTLSRTDDVPTWLALFFAIFNQGELARHGFTRHQGRLLCRHCAGRRRLIKALPPLKGDVTDAASPTEKDK